MNIPVDPLRVYHRPSQNVPLSVLQVLHAAQVPSGVPDPYPADPTHPCPICMVHVPCSFLSSDAISIIYKVHTRAHTSAKTLAPTAP